MSGGATEQTEYGLPIIVSVLESVLPEIPSTLLRSTVVEVIPSVAARTRSAKQLAADPDVLTRGDSVALPAVNRLIRRLRELGYTGVEIPRCSECDRPMKLPHRDGQGGHRCSTCNRKHATPPCTRCGRVLPSGYRILDGAPYCARCWRRDPRTFIECRECGRTRPAGRRTENQAICERCYIPPSRACDRCHRMRPAAISKDGFVLCEGCYSSLRQQLHSCASCGRRRLCPNWRPGGEICAECAEDRTYGQCRSCGANDRRLNGLRCLACVAPEMLRPVISDEAGNPHPQLIPLETYLLQDSRRAEAVVNWIRRSPMSAVVRQMARGELPITLEAVAKLPATGASGYLAALLIESGTVPHGDFDRLRLEIWERAEFVKLRNPEHRKILNRYASWVVNRGFDDSRSTSSDASLRLTRSRTHLTSLIELLTNIDDLGYDLDTYPQRAFDEWVATNGRRGFGVTRFIRWAHAQRLTQLKSEYAPRGMPTVDVTDDVRWLWVRRLLFDEELRLNWRVGGLLALVYGAIGTRIVSIPLEAVDMTKPQVRLALGREPIILPDSLGQLVRRQILAQRKHDPAHRWLFPGRRPGKHLSARALKTPLDRIGINIGPGRATALMTLSRDVAPSILADLLGISIEAASRWSRLSNHDWSAYPRLHMSNPPARPER